MKDPHTQIAVGLEQLVILTRASSGCGFHSDTGGDADDDDLGDAAPGQVLVEPGVMERTPAHLRNGVVGLVASQFGQQVGPAVLEWSAADAAVVGASWGATNDVDQHNGQAAVRERVGKLCGAGGDLRNGVNGGRQALLGCAVTGFRRCRRVGRVR